MITYATLTNQGDRPVNEDSVGFSSNGGNMCFVLCDGLGGHGMGDVASSIVRDAFVKDFETAGDMGAFLDESFVSAQNTLIAEQKARHAEDKMKTTCVALVIDDALARIGHVGDSRLYVFKRNKVYKRTLDHSIPQMLVMSREIKESQIRNHPERSALMRSMGVEWDTPQYELMKPIPIRKCQAFLLCSDGFWELILEEDMCDLLKNSSSPEEWLEGMEKIVLKNGKDKNKDNYSAIAVWCK